MTGSELPAWLEQEIRVHRLSVIDWDRAPMDGDVLLTSNLPALGEVTRHASRHVVVRGSREEHPAGRIDPDFVLASAGTVLVYSRAAYLQLRVTELEQQVEVLSARADAREQEAAELRRLSSSLLRSFSWKVTAPLRFLTHPFFHDAAEKVPEPTAAPRAVEELRRAQSVMVIVCAVPFRSSFNQRPISMARYFAGRGSTVLYVVPQSREPFQQVYPRVFHLSLPEFQAELREIASLSGTCLCTRPDAALVDSARALGAGGYHIHYDLMDDWEEFQRSGEAPWYSAAAERELVRLAATVSAVSPKLAEKFAPVRPDIAVIPNGYDPATLNCPQFAAAHAPLGRKTVGYFGHLSDAWFDWDAVLEAARKLPAVDFELIGYGLSDRSRARLGDYPNIRLEGLVAQGDLHRFARKWWAGMIPFQKSALSAAVDPLKVYEYLHFGLPTVATGISGIAGYPLVQFAPDRAAFVSAIDGIQARPGEQALAGVAEFLRSCLWKERLAKLNDLIRHHEPSGRSNVA